MPSTLGFALLGLLARQARTGYDLTRALRAPIGYFWTASHSQVYPELAALEAAGLIAHRVVDGPGPRDTKRYRITAAGRRALADWIVRPPAPAVERDEFLLKVYSLWAADPGGARALVEAHRAEHDAMHTSYLDQEERMREHWGATLDDPSTPQFSAYATLRRGLSFTEHALRWCDWLLERLDGPAPD